MTIDHKKSIHSLKIVFRIIFPILIVVIFGISNNSFLLQESDPLNPRPENLGIVSSLKFDFATQRLGLNIPHPALNSERNFSYPFRASASVAIADFNNDGLQDLVSTYWYGEIGFYIFIQENSGQFQEKTRELISDYSALNDVTQHVSGVITFDIQNDGLIDLVVLRTGCISVYVNDGHGRLVNRTIEFLEHPVCNGFTGANFTDVDGDGFVDIYLHSASTNYTNPEGSGYSGLEKVNNIFLKNIEGKKFLDRTENFKMNGGSVTWGSLFYYALPLENLVLVNINDFDENSIYYKKRGLDYFIRLNNLPSNLVYGHMGGDVGFLNNEIKPWIYIANGSRAGFSSGFNLFYEWNHSLMRFLDQAKKFGIESCGFGWGTKFGDFDNDGKLDIVATNGYWDFGDRPFWFSYMTYLLGPLSLRGKVQTYNSIPKIEGTQLGGRQKNCLFVQHSNKFVDYAETAGVNDVENGRGVATGDFNNDGKLDFVIANINAPPSLYLNVSKNERRWIGFKFLLESDNKFGIGTSVILKTSAGLQRKDLFPGNGFGGVSENKIHFGLGEDSPIEAEIHFPSGRVDTIRPLFINQYNEIR